MDIKRLIKKLGSALCVLAIVLLVLMPQQAYAATKSPFKDVNSSTPHYDNIVWLYDNSVSTGFGSGSSRTFQPYSNVARCDMAAFLYRLAGSPSYTPTAKDKAYFSDVNSSTPHAKEIWWLASMGISKGWTETNGTHTFRPYANVARCDMAAFLYRMAGSPDYTPTLEERTYFSDIDSSSPHAKEVWWLASTGVSAGWKEGYSHVFRPYANVVRCDMAAFLNRMDDGGLVADPDILAWKAEESAQKSNREVFDEFESRYEAVLEMPRHDRRFAGTMVEMVTAGSEYSAALEDLLYELLAWVKGLPGANVAWLNQSQAKWEADLEAELQPIRDEFNAQPYSGTSYALNLISAEDDNLCDRIDELLGYAEKLL